MAINKISEFPKVTPSADDKILIEKNGEGGHINLSEMPVSTPVNTKIASEVSKLDSRINLIASLPQGSTSGDAELIGIRQGADDVIYANAGTAVRTQFINEKTAREEADNQLKQDLTITINAVKKELNDKKITKFYASNNGNAYLPDSDNGKPTDMVIYGKSVQDGTPTPENPIEIHSVMNPILKMYGKNLFNPTAKTSTANGVTLTNNGDGTFTLSGTPTITKFFSLGDFDALDGITYRLTGCPSGGSNLSYRIWAECDSNNMDFGSGCNFTKSSTPSKKIVIRIQKDYTCNNLVFKPMITLDLNNTYNDFEKFIGEQSATLPYTLNAIPVSDGGNVTIDGQQYVADYVDVERKKLVRMTKALTYSDISNLLFVSKYDTISRFDLYGNREFKLVSPICNMFVGTMDGIIANTINIDGDSRFPIIYFKNTGMADPTSVDEFMGILSNGNFKMIGVLYTPTETDLTDEEIEAFKALETYYPVTNVFVTSDQVDGATIFNYPLNMANGWNYVMEQIGETRPIIYDTEVKVLENAIDTAILTAMMEA